MIFGTNTTVGFKVGQNVNQVPEIMLAYDRQEAVIMPLIANTGDKDPQPNMSRLLPCDFSKPVNPTGVTYKVHPCSLVSVKSGDQSSYSQDSYSVLASFGASFDGSSGKDGLKSKSGLAQYFATGMAAQILALTGGASIVAVGEAAESAAENAPQAANAVPSLFGQTFGDNHPGVKEGQDFAAFEMKLRKRIKDEATKGSLANWILTFEKNVGVDTGMRSSCSALDPCLNRLSNFAEYEDYYVDNKSILEKFNTEID